MPANFTTILLDLDGVVRRRALRHVVMRIVVFGTLIPVVLAQLIVVVGLFWPQREGCGRTRRAVMTTVMSVVRAIEMFQAMNRGRCPREIDVWSTAGLLSLRHRDPFGRPFTVECTVHELRVCSRGRDELDPGDDVCSDDEPAVY